MNQRLLLIIAIGTMTGLNPAVGEEQLTTGMVAATDPSSEQYADFETITVTASRRERPLREVANSISVIDAERIQETLAKDIKDLARDVPWLSVPNDPSRFGLAGFTIRGIGGNRVATEVDGIPLASGFSVGSYASSRRNAVSPALIKQVEVLRGPASALYGSDAIGGLVSFSTYTPEDLLEQSTGDAHRSGSLRYDGRDDSIGVSLLGATRQGNHSGLLALSRRDGYESENTASNPLAAPNPRDYNETDLSARWVYTSARAKTGLSLDLHNQFARTRVDNLEGQGRFASTVALSGEDRQTSRRVALQGSLSLDNRLGDDLDWNLYYSQTFTDQRSFEERVASRRSPAPTQRFPTYRFDERSKGLDVSVSRDREAGNFTHRLLYGLQFRTTRVDEGRDNLLVNLDTGVTTRTVLGETFPVRDFPISQIDEAALFVHDEIEMASGRLLIIPALRAEYYHLNPQPDPIFSEDNPASLPVSISELSLVPKLGAVVHLNERVSLFGQYARGFRSPPFEDANIGLEIPIFNIRAIPNPDLQPETSDSFELGIRLSAAALRGSLSAYVNEYDDFIDSKVNLGPDPQSGVLIFQSLNREQARIKGVELDLTADLGRWLTGLELRTSLARARGEDTVRDLPLNTIDPDRAVIALRYDHPNQRWGTELNARFARGKTRVDDSSTELFRPPGHGLIDLLAYRRFARGAQVNLSLHNLSDRQYWDWADVRGRPADDPLIGLYSGPGFNVSAAIKLEW